MKTIAIISGIFTPIFLFLNRDKPLLLNLSDASFLLALIFVMLAMVVYIRNIGLFKTFAYNSYRKTVRKNRKEEKKEKEKDFQGKLDEKIEGIDPRDEDMLEFHEFTQQKYSVQWSNKKYIIGAILMYLASHIFSIFL